MKNKIVSLLLNISTFIIFILVSASIWEIFVVEKMYIIWERLFLADFIPPFVNSKTFLYNGVSSTSLYFEHYIAAKWLVYTIWISLIVLSILATKYIQRIAVRKRLIILGGLLLMVILSVITTSSSEWRLFIPFFTDRKFTELCKQLSGKELTYQNIEPLQGDCYDDYNGHVGVEKCQPKHVAKFQTQLDDPLRISDRENIFTINQHGLDGTWACNIEMDDKKMRTYYYFSKD